MTNKPTYRYIFEKENVAPEKLSQNEIWIGKGSKDIRGVFVTHGQVASVLQDVYKTNENNPEYFVSLSNYLRV